MKQDKPKLSPAVKRMLAGIDADTRLGDLRRIAKDVKRDHQAALELWATGDYFPRLLATLIMDPKMMSQDLVDMLDGDIRAYPAEQRQTLVDWLMANQLAKHKKGIALMESWEHSASALQRRLYWYYQARLRWVGQAPPPNTDDLLAAIEARIVDEDPDVQWAMNFTAAQIGIFQPAYRDRCIALGERTGLYRDEVVARNCTPDYLPAFIAVQVEKLRK